MPNVIKSYVWERFSIATLIAIDSRTVFPISSNWAYHIKGLRLWSARELDTTPGGTAGYELSQALTTLPMQEIIGNAISPAQIWDASHRNSWLVSHKNAMIVTASGDKVQAVESTPWMPLDIMVPQLFHSTWGADAQSVDSLFDVFFGLEMAYEKVRMDIGDILALFTAFDVDSFDQLERTQLFVDKPEA